MLELLFANGPKQGQMIVFEGGSMTFGRSEAYGQLALAWDRSISSKHFQIIHEGDQYTIVDLGSRNGTRVNGRAIDRALLSNMDRIEVGNTLLVVRFDQSKSLATPEHSPPPSPFAHRTNSSPVEDSSWKSRSSSPIEGSFADFQPVLESDQPMHHSPLHADAIHDETDDRLWQKSSLCISSNAPQMDIASGSATPESRMPESPNENLNRSSVAQVIRQVRVRIQEGYGQQEQRLYWIGPGELLTIGRNSACDCCLPHDGRLSPQHVAIEATDRECTVTDLRSDDGTWLNGARIEKAPLFHGDTLWAGAAVFLIEIETLDGYLRPQKNNSDVAATAPPHRASAFNASMAPLDVSHPSSAVANSRAGTTRGRPAAASDVILIEQQVLAHDGYAITGQFSDSLPPEWLLERLMELGSVYLLIDLSKVTLPYPESCDIVRSKLFDWLPNAAATRSPHLFKASELLDPVAYWKESLGSDAVVCLLSPLLKSKLLEALREMLHNPDGHSETTAGIVGIYWPSSLCAMLDQGTFGLSKSLFESVHCVLTEYAGATKWRLYVREQAIGERLIERWSSGGLKLQQSQK